MSEFLRLFFEVEHVLNEALFNNDDIRRDLARIGITIDMPANKRAFN
jgi:hypothetical protein